MALAAGFGLDFERCDPMIFEEVLDILEEQAVEARREQAMQDLKGRMGQ